jgi:Ran GTPase-activating protein (RanGAP) involved in mRNA processing and transport
MPEPFATTCQVGADFVPCDPSELLPLVHHLESGAGVQEQMAFPRGTLLPDGRLDLCKQRIGPEGAQLVARALSGYAHVQHLLMGADGLGDSGAKAVAELAKANAGLKTIYLGCNFIGAEGAGALADALAAHPGIRGLWLKRNPIGPAGAAVIAEMLLQRNTTLHILDLVNTEIGVEGATLVVRALMNSPALVERLYLSGNRLTAAVTGCLAELLRSNGPLRHLYLAVNDLGDEGAVGLADGLKGNTTLRTLSLASNVIGPAGAGALVEGLRGHRALEVLDLGYDPSTQVLGRKGNRLGDQGASVLIDLLYECPALVEMDLSSNGITDVGARILAEALEGNSRLRRLELGKGVSPLWRQEVQALLEGNPAGNRSDPDIEAIKSVYRTRIRK